MAITLGTNTGFVEAAPDADPGGSSTFNGDNSAFAVKDTSDASAGRVTEIGWWADTATEEANFEVAIYSHDAGNDRPNVIIGSDLTNAKGVGSGWIRSVGLNISISASTIYWIAYQLDDTATNTKYDRSFGTPPRSSVDTGRSTLRDPWTESGTGSFKYVVYAVWDEGGEPPEGTNTQINIGDAWKEIEGMQINIGDAWKTVDGAQINIGDAWKTIF